MNSRNTKPVTLPKNEEIKVLRGKTMTTITFGRSSSSTSFAKTPIRSTNTAMKRMTFIVGSKKRMRGRRHGQTSTNSS